MEYTLAFIFDDTLSEVLLIKKTKPDWQAGYLNGIGGKREHNETTTDCIIREVYEECGLRNIHYTPVGVIQGEEYLVTVFTARVSRSILEEASTKTEEEVQLYKMVDLPTLNLLPSVKYLIPMCIQPYIDPNFISFKTKYEEKNNKG